MSDTGLEFECAPGFDPFVEGGKQYCTPTSVPAEVPCWGREHEEFNLDTDSCICNAGYIRDIDTYDCVTENPNIGSNSQSQLHPSISQSQVPPTAYASMTLVHFKDPKFWVIAAVSAVASYMIMDTM